MVTQIDDDVQKKKIVVATYKYSSIFHTQLQTRDSSISLSQS